MTKQEFIDSLTAEELQMLVGEFFDWQNWDTCPYRVDSNFPCYGKQEFEKDKQDGEVEGEFDSLFDCPNDSQEGCWAEYYVWRYRQKKEKARRMAVGLETPPFDEAKQLAKLLSDKELAAAFENAGVTGHILDALEHEYNRRGSGKQCDSCKL